MNTQALAVGTAVNCTANCRGSKHLGRCRAPEAPTDMLADYHAVDVATALASGDAAMTKSSSKLSTRTSS